MKTLFLIRGLFCRPTKPYKWKRSPLLFKQVKVIIIHMKISNDVHINKYFLRNFNFNNWKVKKKCHDVNILCILILFTKMASLVIINVWRSTQAYFFLTWMQQKLAVFWLKIIEWNNTFSRYCSNSNDTQI
jgi:hypothetical protein